MKLRTLSLIVLVLLVLSAIAYFVQRPAPPPSADPRVGQSLLGGDLITQAAAVKVADQGKSVTLTRRADNAWNVTSYHDLPADFSKLSRLVNELSEARIQRLVTSNPERIGRLDFKDTRIELLDSASQPLLTLVFGRHADAGGRYVRFGDEPKAYLANLNAWIDAEPKNWANSQLIDLKPEDIARAEITFPDGASVIVTRANKDAPWQPENSPAGQQIKPDRISSLLTSLTSLRFSDTTEPGDARVQEARAHERTFTLKTFDDRSVTIALGRKPEEKKLKPPAPSADGKSGPAALGSVSDLAKATPAADAAKSGDAPSEPGPAPLTPEYETIPAGPVFVAIKHSEASAPVNALMAKRAFQAADYVFTGLPQNRAELFEPVPAAPATPAAASATAAPAAGPDAAASESPAASPAAPTAPAPATDAEPKKE